MAEAAARGDGEDPEGVLGVHRDNETQRQLSRRQRAPADEYGDDRRVRKDKVATTDGPFAETKEQLGGYYLLKARDLNEAIQLASKIPGARFGSVEVRPVMEMQS